MTLLSLLPFKFWGFKLEVVLFDLAHLQKFIWLSGEVL